MLSTGGSAEGALVLHASRARAAAYAVGSVLFMLLCGWAPVRYWSQGDYLFAGLGAAVVVLLAAAPVFARHALVERLVRVDERGISDALVPGRPVFFAWHEVAAVFVLPHRSTNSFAVTRRGGPLPEMHAGRVRSGQRLGLLDDPDAYLIDPSEFPDADGALDALLDACRRRGVQVRDETE